MPDILHQWGADLTTGPTGDLATASGTTLGQQRILRRLLTNPGEYIWQQDYGAGLGQFIGQPGNAMRIRAAIRSQMFKEISVARRPEPVIDVDLNTMTSSGAVFVHIRYVDAPSGQTQYLSFPMER